MVYVSLVIWISLVAISSADESPTSRDFRVYLPFLRRAGPAPVAVATWGSSIAISPATALVWTSNPDAGTVAAIDPIQLEVIHTVPIDGEPWSLAFTPDGALLLVVDRANSTLVGLDPQQLQMRFSIALGAEPGQVVTSPDGRRAYVTVTAENTLAIVDLERGLLLEKIGLPPRPYALALNRDGSRIYVTHFQAQARAAGGMGRDDGADGLVSVLNAAGEVLAPIVLPPDQHGFANQLAGIAIHQNRAWVPHIRAAPEMPNRLSSTVFAAVSSLDLTTGHDDESARLHLNDEQVFASPVNNPVAAVPAPDGARLYVVLAGSDLVEVVDVAAPVGPRLLGFLPTGSNPRDIAISPDGRYGYVMSYLSRTVTVLDLVQMRRIADVPVAPETLAPTVLRGKILFNTVTDPRMAKSSWISCASCHPGGGTDGVTWQLLDGPRQVPPLWNAGATLPWHWSAALDELQDVEDSIHVLQFGIGLAAGADPPLLGVPNAGRSDDLDALAAYLEQGEPAPQRPKPDGDLAAGRSLFVSRGCAACHGGPQWTLSALPGAAGTLDPDGNGMVDAALRDVGTLNPADVRGAGGFDVPSLLDVGSTAPYLHDGSLLTLTDLLDSGHPLPTAGQPQSLTDAERDALLAFLLSIDAETPPVSWP
jgi:DNA-binding beta-propeller fold protein YncE